MKRRDFIKISGAAALTAACGPRVETPSAPAHKGMEIRENPYNGDKVSLLGYGCMRWPMVPGPDGNDIIDQEAVNEMVDYAMAHGINYYDTSPAYLQGQSEKAAGIALSRYPRESYFLATKLSNFRDSTPEASMQMLEDSLEQLGTTYFDYYLLHSIGGGGVPVFEKRYVENGMIDYLKQKKEEGVIRNLGFSFHGSPETFDYFMSLHDKGEIHWDFVQIEMNYIDWNHADGVRNTNASYLYAELDKREIPIVVMEPLLGGRLANVPANIAAQLKARDPEHSVASWAFRFVGTYPRILCILSGMSSMDPLKENVETFGNFIPLTEEELAFMEHLAVEMKEYPLVNCTNCKYCMPCPFGIDIPGVFQHYNNSVTEGTYAQSKEQKGYRRLKRAYLTSYDKAISSVRQADHCIGCGQCVEHCPQSIKIPDELLRIARYVEALKQDTL